MLTLKIKNEDKEKLMNLRIEFKFFITIFLKYFFANQ